MVTGQRPFAGDSRLALLTRIVNQDPQPPSEIAPVSPELEKLTLRCLRKDPSRRYQTMADLKVALEDLQAEASGSQKGGSGSLSPPPRTTLQKIMLIVAIGAGAVVLTLLAVRAFRHTPDTSALRTVKFTITATQLWRGAENDIDAEVSISRDGKHIAYVEFPDGQLWVRDIDQEQAHPVPGATGVNQAFWSPDGQSVGYASGKYCAVREGCDLLRIPVPQRTCFAVAARWFR